MTKPPGIEPPMGEAHRWFWCCAEAVFVNGGLPQTAWAAAAFKVWRQFTIDRAMLRAHGAPPPERKG